MNKFTKFAGLSLCILAFSAFALGSGSEKSSTTSVTVEANKDQASDEHPTEANEDAEASEAEKKEMAYEVTGTRFDHYENSIGTREYHAIVEITNTGSTDIYLDKCTFDFEDDNGHLLQSESLITTAPDIIAPGEKGYYFNSLGSIDESVSLDNGINLVPQMKLTEGKGEIVDYPVSDVTLKESDYGGVGATGRVENNTDEEISYLSVYIVLYDDAGNVLDIISGNVTEVAPGNKGSFDISNIFGNDQIQFTDVKDYKVYARKMHMQF